MKRSYNIVIKDLKQPVLIMRPTKRDERLGKTQNTALIPELCYFTGLSEEDRSNYVLLNAS